MKRCHAWSDLRCNFWSYIEVPLNLTVSWWLAACLRLPCRLTSWKTPFSNHLLFFRFASTFASWFIFFANHISLCRFTSTFATWWRFFAKHISFCRFTSTFANLSRSRFIFRHRPSNQHWLCFISAIKFISDESGTLLTQLLDSVERFCINITTLRSTITYHTTAFFHRLWSWFRIFLRQRQSRPLFYLSKSYLRGISKSVGLFENVSFNAFYLFPYRTASTSWAGWFTWSKWPGWFNWLNGFAWSYRFGWFWHRSLRLIWHRSLRLAFLSWFQSEFLGTSATFLAT